MEVDYVPQPNINSELSPNQSLSNSPSPEQRHSPRGSVGMIHEQSLHIIVEPQIDGHRNIIYLINPPTGEIISQGFAEHGAHIEIQPGVIFRVPYPHEHQSPYSTAPPMQPHQLQQQNAYQSYPLNLPPSGQNTNNMSTMVIPTQYHPEMVNATCPMHGSPHSNGNNTHVSGNDRLDKTRQKLQKKLKGKSNGASHCTCSYKQPYLSYNNYDEMYMDKKMMHISDDRAPLQDQCGLVERIEDGEIEKDISICTPPKAFVESPYAIIITWEETVSNNSHLSDCIFDLQISNKGNNNYRTIFNGKTNTFRASKLRPGTEYFFRLQATWGNIQGPYSDVVACTTPLTVPDKPLPPRISQKTKSALTLKWNTPLQDGGCQITSYRLQWLQGYENETFMDLYVGSQKLYKHNHKLDPGTPCQFRLQASNKIGNSEWSNILGCLTSAGPPNMPEKPELDESGTHYIRLKWMEPGNNGSAIEEYKLEMEDPNDGYGFMVRYIGDKMSYCCQNLKRNTCYKFRLSASNQQGYSRCSPPSLYSTIPEVPGKMEKPKLNGKPRTNMIFVKWDPPKDSGGDEIIGYILQIDDGRGGVYTNVYRGIEHECTVDHLKPGHTYHIRVASESKAGVGSFSSHASLTTLPVAPRDPQPPRLNKAEANCLHLEWEPPHDNGGAQITNYVVSMTSSLQEDFKQVYTGCRQVCSVTNLSPGHHYYFKTQAENQAGKSQWSSVSTLQTAPSAPDAPMPPSVSFKSPTHIRLDWAEPVLHGAEVTSYCVEKLENDTFCKVYQGNCLYCEIKKNISPASYYYFRLQALSSVSAGPYSNVFSVETPPSSPGSVTEIKVIEQTSSSCLIQWRHPIENGSPVHEYILEATGATSMMCTVPRPKPVSVVDLNASVDSTARSEDRSSGIECDDSEAESGDEESESEAVTESITGSEASSSTSKLSDDIMEFRLNDLTADASYKLRIQAVNGVGAGSFSHSIQFFTKELPPLPPSLSASSITHHSLKLKWGDSTMKKSLAVLNHNLQMQNKSGNFTTVYNGIGTSFTLSKLKELTPYCCRIRSKNDAGEGEFSKPCIFYTKPQPPPTIKDLKYKETSATSVQLRWTSVDCLRDDDTIEYRVQMLDTENSKDYVQVYQGEKTKCQVKDLKSDQIYQFRVHPIRYLSEAARSSVPSSVEEIKGVYSKPVRVETQAEKPTEDEQDEHAETISEDVAKGSSFTDTHLALMILGSFLVICMLIAALLKWVMAETQN